MPQLVDLDYLDLNTDYHQQYEKSLLTQKRSTVTSEGVRAGWYQDSKGSLYNYDGVIWDVVPADMISRLEYLG